MNIKINAIHSCLRKNNGVRWLNVSTRSMDGFPYSHTPGTLQSSRKEYRLFAREYRPSARGYPLPLREYRLPWRKHRLQLPNLLPWKLFSDGPQPFLPTSPFTLESPRFCRAHPRNHKILRFPLLHKQPETEEDFSTLPAMDGGSGSALLR